MILNHESTLGSESLEEALRSGHGPVAMYIGLVFCICFLFSASMGPEEGQCFGFFEFDSLICTPRIGPLLFTDV